MNAANQLFKEFRKYLHYNKIFLSRDLFELFSKIESALIETEVKLKVSGRNPWEQGDGINAKLNEVGGGLLKQVEDAVQRRLHFDQT